MATSAQPLLHTCTLGAEDAPDVAFLPGFTGSYRTWNDDFRQLQHSYRLIMFDLLGFGRSPKPDLAYSVDDHLSALHRTLHTQHVRSAVLVGYSMGSLLALAYADRYPAEVKALVLLAAPLYRSEQEARRTIKNSSLFNRLLALDNPLARFSCELMCMTRPLAQRLVPHIVQNVPAVVAHDALDHTWTSYSRTLQNVIFQAQPQRWLRSVEKPVLMIFGQNDHTAPAANLDRSEISGAQVQIEMLDAGHNLVFTRSAEVAQRLAAFLRTGVLPANKPS